MRLLLLPWYFFLLYLMWKREKRWSKLIAHIFIKMFHVRTTLIWMFEGSKKSKNFIGAGYMGRKPMIVSLQLLFEQFCFSKRVGELLETKVLKISVKNLVIQSFSHTILSCSFLKYHHKLGMHSKITILVIS